MAAYWPCGQSGVTNGEFPDGPVPNNGSGGLVFAALATPPPSIAAPTAARAASSFFMFPPFEWRVVRAGPWLDDSAAPMARGTYHSDGLFSEVHARLCTAGRR